MSLLELKTFGFPELSVDGRTGSLTLRKALALMIFLAETKGPVGRDAAATLLWPNADTETARARLRRLLHRIEGAVGAPIIEADRMAMRYQAAVEVRLDSELFESACD